MFTPDADRPFWRISRLSCFDGRLHLVGPHFPCPRIPCGSKTVHWYLQHSEMMFGPWFLYFLCAWRSNMLAHWRLFPFGELQCHFQSVFEETVLSKTLFCFLSRVCFYEYFFGTFKAERKETKGHVTVKGASQTSNTCKSLLDLSDLVRPRE